MSRWGRLAPLLLATLAAACDSRGPAPVDVADRDAGAIDHATPDVWHTPPTVCQAVGQAKRVKVAPTLAREVTLSPDGTLAVVLSRTTDAQSEETQVWLAEPATGRSRHLVDGALWNFVHGTYRWVGPRTLLTFGAGGVIRFDVGSDLTLTRATVAADACTWNASTSGMVSVNDCKKGLRYRRPGGSWVAIPQSAGVRKWWFQGDYLIYLKGGCAPLNIVDTVTHIQRQSRTSVLWDHNGGHLLADGRPFFETCDVPDVIGLVALRTADGKVETLNAGFSCITHAGSSCGTRLYEIFPHSHKRIFMQGPTVVPLLGAYGKRDLPDVDPYGLGLVLRNDDILYDGLRAGSHGVCLLRQTAERCSFLPGYGLHDLMLGYFSVVSPDNTHVVVVGSHANGDDVEFGILDVVSNAITPISGVRLRKYPQAAYPLSDVALVWGYVDDDALHEVAWSVTRQGVVTRIADGRYVVGPVGNCALAYSVSDSSGDATFLVALP